jgi:hypothetical protein
MSAARADRGKSCRCKKKEEVYKAVIVGTNSPVPDFSPQNRCGLGSGTVSIPAAGHDTVLGAFTSEQSHCITPPSLDFTNGVFAATQAADVDGNGALDTLTGTYSGALIPAGPGVFLIDGRLTFTTSTGLASEGAASGRVIFNLDGTSDSIVVIDGCVSDRKKP